MRRGSIEKMPLCSLRHPAAVGDRACRFETPASEFVQVANATVFGSLPLKHFDRSRLSRVSFTSTPLSMKTTPLSMKTQQSFRKRAIYPSRKRRLPRVKSATPL
jgi:hypothetical protein